MDAYSALRNGLLAAWCPSLGDGGLLVQDRSPWRRNTALPTAIVTQYSGKTCLKTSGATTVTTPYNVAGLGDFTASAWCYADLFVSAGRIIDTSYVNGFWIGQGTSSGQFGGGILQSSSPYGTYITSRLNAWLCVTMRRQGTLQTLRVYDSASVSVASATVSSSALSSNTLYLASANNNLNRWSGGIDDVRVYGRALTDSECDLLATRPGIGLTPTRGCATKFPTTLYQNVAGVWKPTTPLINVGGTWKTASPAINVGGVWR